MDLLPSLAAHPRTPSSATCAGDSAMDAVRARLGVKTVPEQLYTDNFLRLTHTGSGTSVAFSAADALQGTTHTP